MTKIKSPKSLIGITTSNINTLVDDPGKWVPYFHKEGVHPYDEIEWVKKDAIISSPDGSIKFEQKDVEVPVWWTETTINIVASKYFRYINNVKEFSVKQLFNRVAETLRMWAEKNNYFSSSSDGDVYERELIWLLLHQFGAFNSPVWFNLGVPGREQQASACFISSVSDTLESINEFSRSEKVIFAGGSGSGANMSALRSSYEKLSSGSLVCGPLGWMEELDKGAKAMKSGGSTRNAAKMVVLDMDHPDILECQDGRPGFIVCKSIEEKRAHDLIGIGYSSAFDDPNSAYKWVSYQNANHSISASDAFMEAVENDGLWNTVSRTTGEVVKTYKARDLWYAIAKAAWECGDPGIQFSDTINYWHTTPKNGRIKSSNPCSEFLHVDNTACNLCAINLTKFFSNGVFDITGYKNAIRVFVVAQNAIINNASYPTEQIKINSHLLRPIGLNYGDLGSLLMKLGYGYDSDGGRAIAARLASLMTGYAYLTSVGLAKITEPFHFFEINKKEMLDVMFEHRKANSMINKKKVSENKVLNWSSITNDSDILWDCVCEFGEKYGFSISQATLQAPLGTISFLMGMDTTGIEPAFSLVSYKSLVGGGMMKIVNNSVSESLKNLGYDNDSISLIVDYISDNGHIEDAPGFKNEHLPIFDCAMTQFGSKSGRYLSPMAHLNMMAAIQPLITCAQSKTVNLPNSATIEDIADIYFQSWKLGIKCVALYRDGCKASQPLSTKKTEEKTIDSTLGEMIASSGVKRRDLPSDCVSSRHRFEINGYKGYIITSEYEDGTLGEVFLKLGKSGSTLDGVIDGFTKLLSIALQHGIPLEKLIGSFINTKFDPSGFTSNSKIRFCQSLYDYLFKYLDLKYFNGEISGVGSLYGNSLSKKEEKQVSDETVSQSITSIYPSKPTNASDAPPCPNCGSMTRRNGSCHLCDTCGTTTGCS